MLQFLLSFGCGISFAIGITIGTVICTLATRKGRAEFLEFQKESAKAVEDRLSKYVVNTERLAIAAEMIAKRVDENHRTSR